MTLDTYRHSVGSFDLVLSKTLHKKAKLPVKILRFVRSNGVTVRFKVLNLILAFRLLAGVEPNPSTNSATRTTGQHWPRIYSLLNWNHRHTAQFHIAPKLPTPFLTETFQRTHTPVHSTQDWKTGAHLFKQRKNNNQLQQNIRYLSLKCELFSARTCINGKTILWIFVWTLTKKCTNWSRSPARTVILFSIFTKAPLDPAILSKHGA